MKKRKLKYIIVWFFSMIILSQIHIFFLILISILEFNTYQIKMIRSERNEK